MQGPTCPLVIPSRRSEQNPCLIILGRLTKLPPVDRGRLLGADLPTFFLNELRDGIGHFAHRHASKMNLVLAGLGQPIGRDIRIIITQNIAPIDQIVGPAIFELCREGGSDRLRAKKGGVRMK